MSGILVTAAFNIASVFSVMISPSIMPAWWGLLAVFLITLNTFSLVRQVRRQISLTISPKIVTDFWMKPVPNRSFDWSAVTDNYEGGDGYSERGGPVGHGSTEAEAIADLLEQLED